ncbi:MAG: DNA-methyltransferase, partial [Candidatus Xenobia bacterium]
GAYMAMLRRVFAEVFRVTVDGGRCCINVANTGRNPYVPLSSHVDLMMERLGWWMRGHIVWMKADTPNGTAWGSFGSASNPVLRDQHEYLMVYSKGSPRLGPAQRTMESQEFMEAARSIWRIDPEPRRGNHPAPFPLEIPRRLTRLYSFPGDLVLDPFAGAGTTLVAAEAEGRRSVGYELVPEYAESARQRVLPQ